MKLSFHLGALLPLLFFLCFSSKLHARPLAIEQGRNISKASEVSGEHLVFGLQGRETLELMGMEYWHCNHEDEECLQRRMTLEAHLDYIYTQHHKP